MASYAHFEFDYSDGVAVVRLLDAHLIERELFAELYEELRRYLMQERPSVIAISFESVKRFSSETISVLLKTQDQISSYGGKLYLCEMRKEIREAFEVLRLNFPIFDTVHDAVHAA